MAVSTTSDALGPYYLYQFPLGNNFPDYPKWGRWTTSWAQTMNMFNPSGTAFLGAQVCMYERAQLLAGSPTPRQVCFQLTPNDDSLLPGDIDSATAPPSARNEFFIGSVAAVNNSHLSLYSAHVVWSPFSASISGANNSHLITVPTYSGPCGGSFGGDCVPQQGVSDKLDSLGDRLMYRFAYSNDPPGGIHTALVCKPRRASLRRSIGVRWYEFHAPPITQPWNGVTLAQTGTYAPDSNYRWMASIAADRNDNILLGYSESSSTLYPSIAVAGKLQTPFKRHPGT